MPDEHGALPQCRRQRLSRVVRVAREDEIALEGRTSNPSRIRAEVRSARLRITAERAFWKWASSSSEAIAPAWASRPSG